MTTVAQNTAITEEFHLPAGISWRDPDIDCTLTVSQPSVDPALWAEYAAGAQRSYRKHGVECALDAEALASGTDTRLFCTVIDDYGRIVAGNRAIGPLRSADDSHAVVEWAGQPAQQSVRDMINGRVPFGVVEMKSGWVTDDRDRNRFLSDTLVRSVYPMMALLNVRFCMATSAAYLLNRWRSCGGVVAPIPAAPYPDERYQTKMLWFSRHDFAKYAQPEQVAKILRETNQLTQELHRRGELGTGLPLGS
jgi:hypothetical protein